MPTREEFELRKLELEVQSLARPHTRNPTFWISVVSAVVAVVGIFAQNYLSKIEAAQAKLDKSNAEELRDKATKELAEIEKARVVTQTKVKGLEADRIALASEKEALLQTRTTLNREISNLNEDVDRLKRERENQEKQTRRLVDAVAQEKGRVEGALSVAATAASNSLYSVAVYTLGIGDAKTLAVSRELQRLGYTLLKSEALQTRPTWLATSPTVLYYDDTSIATAKSIAKSVEKIVGATITIARGAGDGIPKGRERTNFRVHIVAP